MTVSDLIARLEALKAAHGDIPVAVVGDGQCDLLSVHAEMEVEIEGDDGLPVRMYPVAVCLDVTG